MEISIFENKDKFNFKGRYAFVDKSLCLGFTASGFEFKADFHGSDCLIDAEIIGEISLIGVILDGDYEKMYEIPVVEGKQRITVAEKLDGVHSIRVVKLSECRMYLIKVSSVIFDGEFKEKPNEKKLKFEFYGDSLTCGYGNLCNTRNLPEPFGLLEHGYKTWAVLLCEKIGAEMSAVSSSGKGILTDNHGNKEGTVFKYYDKAVPTYNIDWDFKKYVPDGIFIYLGVNDINYRKNNPDDKIDWNEFYIRSNQLIDAILVNSPNAKVIYLSGHDTNNPFYNDYCEIYQRISQERENVFFCEGLTSTQSGGNWHPSLADDVEIFEKLYSFLKEKFDF